VRNEAKRYTDKIAIRRWHLLDKIAISTLRKQLSFEPTVFYRWRKEFLENRAAAFLSNRPVVQLEEAGTD
jgi:transposase-like protein